MIKITETVFSIWEVMADNSLIIKCILCHKANADAFCGAYNENYKPRKFKVYQSTLSTGDD